MQSMKQIVHTEGGALRPLPAAMSYGATVDIHKVEQEITEFMIRRACEEMDSQQQFPFCGRKPKLRRG